MQLPGRGNGSPRLTALLLIGHGSARYPDAGSVLWAHAETLRLSGIAATVGLLAGTPDVRQALDRLPAGPTHVVPFFMDDGHFARVAMPAALGLTSPSEARDRRGRSLILHPPIGVHPRLPALIARRAPAGTVLLLVGHGSARAPGRRMAAHDHADALRAMGGFPVVETAFLEEPPFVPDALAGIGDRPVAVMGLFANAGTHVRDDLPRLLRTPGRSHTPEWLGIIGDDPGLCPLILDMIANHEETP